MMTGWIVVQLFTRRQPPPPQITAPTTTPLLTSNSRRLHIEPLPL